jgi:hypothetical protein
LNRLLSKIYVVLKEMTTPAAAAPKDPTDFSEYAIPGLIYIYGSKLGFCFNKEGKIFKIFISGGLHGTKRILGKARDARIKCRTFYSEARM